ncbi:MAG TPA: DUF4397 domain-containing protein [Ferruginibacter sp.]|nr:DUF4397 domain-containing protein [Ferruginibacter sp.]
MNIFSKIILLFLVSGLFITGCSKNAGSPIPVVYTTNQAKLKVVFASAYLIRDSVQLKINDVRVSNAFLSVTSTNTPTPFPGGGLNTGGSNFNYYLDLPPGDNRLTVSVPKKLTTIDSILRYSGIINLASGKTYSVYITDTTLTTKVVLVQENLTPPVNTTSRFRFLNLMPNVPSLDLYWAGTKVATAVYASTGFEFTLPYTSVGQWAVRATGTAPTSTPLAVYTTTATGYLIPNRRIMTVFARGYSGATGTRIPTVSLLFN